MLLTPSSTHSSFVWLFLPSKEQYLLELLLSLFCCFRVKKPTHSTLVMLESFIANSLNSHRNCFVFFVHKEKSRNNRRFIQKIRWYNYKFWWSLVNFSPTVIVSCVCSLLHHRPLFVAVNKGSERMWSMVRGLTSSRPRCYRQPQTKRMPFEVV